MSKKPVSRIIYSRIDEDTNAKLRKIAKAERRTISSLIFLAVHVFVTKWKESK